MNIGEAIKFCRSRRNLTQAELAKRSAMSVSYLSMVEKNRRDPSLRMIEKVAGGLGIPASLLVLIASDPRELEPIDRAVAEKISYIAMNLLREENDVQESLL